MRLEDGDILHEPLEQFAGEKDLRAATVIAVGGADKGSKLIVGPEDGRAEKIVPMDHELGGVHEVAGVGTIFPNESGEPVLHMHVAAGRKDSSVTGCVRRGVKTWQVLEVVIRELIESPAVRKHDPVTGFELLQP